MANFKGPLDYIDVATRIVEFREKYPEGRLRQKDIQFIDFAGKSWVVFTAEAWRSADDPAPAHGTAWEPVPGPTQFTRDSELQNAETAAWGRAMVAALAVDTRKGIASSEEVRNRQPEAARAQSGPPMITSETLEEWVSAIADVSTLPQLQSVWEQAGAAGVTRNKAIVAAKDKRKLELTNG
jgi:hypothetical protein